MNRVLIKSLILAAMLIPSLSWGYSTMAPHNSSNNVGCSSCHTTHTAYSVNNITAYQNVCLSCHRPGKMSKADGPTTPFTLADMANPFKTYTAARTGVLYQTSHKWFGSDNVPAAGALPPVGTHPTQLLNKTSERIDLNGTLSCSRCHDLTNSASQSFVNRANDFLRKDNSDDGLCLDCHRPRNNADATKGSHPVNIVYANAQHPENLYATPQSTNPANYTASMNLKNGKIQCSTCHRAHYADSNAYTFDNRTSARFGLLSTSSGNLLKTGLRGATADARNICTNCHINKLAHNGASQGVQCADCHGGHVDLGDGSTPNQFLVNRLINFSSARGAVRNAQVLFQYTSAARWNFNGTKGICVACHTVPAPGSYNGKIYPSQHASTDPKVCVQCHYHSSASGSFSGGCSTCHGFPPQTSATGGPNGKVVGYPLDESQTKHLKHSDAGYLCIECHYDTGNLPALHRNSLTNDVFNPAHIAEMKASYGGRVPKFNPATRTCSNVYCHGNGDPTGLPATSNTTAAWLQGAAVTCNSCHAATPATNGHAVHLAKGYACEVCHSATVSGSSTIINKAEHADTTKDVQFNGASLGFTLGNSCDNVYCHSNAGGAKVAPPAWTAAPTGNCTVCHPSSGISSGAHQKHLALSGYGPKLNGASAPTSCNNCHTYPAGHVNGSIQSPSNCTTVCHPGGLGTATWTGSDRVSCDSCHGQNPAYINNYAPSKASFASVGHGSKVQTTITCASCHNPNADHIGVAGGTKRLTNSTNALCTSCHRTYARVEFQNMTTHFSAKGVQTANCSTCHDTHGSGNLSALREVISFGPRSSAVISIMDKASGLVNTDTNVGFCQVCHTQTTHYRRGVEETDHATTDCLTCHQHSKGFRAGSCDGCHGYPPAPRNVAVEFSTFRTFNNWTSAKFESYSGGGGAHLIPGHIPPGAKASEGWANCSACHNEGVTNPTPYHAATTPVSSHVDNVTVKVDRTYVFNADRFINYSGAKLVNAPQVNKSGRCFNVSCHLAPSPRWSTER